jgi:hypothetical protein
VSLVPRLIAKSPGVFRVKPAGSKCFLMKLDKTESQNSDYWKMVFFFWGGGGGGGGGFGIKKKNKKKLHETITKECISHIHTSPDICLKSVSCLCA